MMEHARNDLHYKWMKWALAAGIMVLMGVCYSCSRDGGKQDEGLLLSQASGDGQEGAIPSGTDGQGNASGQAADSSSAPSGQPGQNAEGSFPGGEGAEGDAASGQQGDASAAGEAMGTCFVHICGAVAEPGVYQMAENSRVYQVVEAAGGFLPQADQGYLNLAAPVYDGMKITVYTLEEAGTAPPWEASYSYTGSKESQGGEGTEAKVNINTASKEELMSLKGIGESRAEDIIAYREKHGAFSEIEEIMQVPGIKDGAFQKIKETITVR